MLPSWIDKYHLQGCESVALVLSRDTLAAVKVSRCSGEHSIIGARQCDLPRRMFSKEHNTDDVAAMSKTINMLIEDLDADSLPLHVALPDLVIKASVYELDQLPKSRKERNDFIVWRLAKEYGQREGEIECRVDYMGEADNRQLVYAQIADKYWLEVVRDALSACSMVPWTINSYSYYRHNYMVKNGFSHSLLLLTIDEGSWSLSGWDKHQRIRVSTTRMIDGIVDEHVLASIGREVVRAARVVDVKLGDEGEVAFYVQADKQYVDYMKAMLESLLSCSVMAVVTPENHSSTNDDLRLHSLGYMSAIS